MAKLKNLQVVTIGGGTGHFELLNSLKAVVNPKCITAIPGVADNGGSSGRLRTEFGVLPPGDARRCMLALAPLSRQKYLADWLNFRFPKGSTEKETISGHNIGNLNIAALEIMYGSQEAALEVLMKILDIPGKVIPVSNNKTSLLAKLSDGSQITGETDIDLRFKKSTFNPKIKIDTISLKDAAFLSPSAKDAIENADWLIIAPGDLYTSILPVFLVSGFTESVQASGAKVIYCGNLMTKEGETDGFKASDCLAEILKYLALGRIDYLILNESQAVPAQIISSYSQEGKRLIETDLEACRQFLPEAKFVMDDFLRYIPTEQIVRHDRNRLGKAILQILK